MKASSTHRVVFPCSCMFAPRIRRSAYPSRHAAWEPKIQQFCLYSSLFAIECVAWKSITAVKATKVCTARFALGARDCQVLRRSACTVGTQVLRLPILEGTLVLRPYWQ